MPSKYDPYVHCLFQGPLKGRYIVAKWTEEKGWHTSNTKEQGAGVRYGAGIHALAEQDVRTYANVNAAVKAARRIYDLSHLPSGPIKQPEAAKEEARDRCA